MLPRQARSRSGLIKRLTTQTQSYRTDHKGRLRRPKFENSSRPAQDSIRGYVVVVGPTTHSVDFTLHCMFSTNSAKSLGNVSLGFH